MSSSRATSGCYTCRIRRKKCDEQKPMCQACLSRGIQCYGYGERPEWMQNKVSWQDILNSEEAKQIRKSAARTYAVRRTEHRERVSERERPNLLDQTTTQETETETEQDVDSKLSKAVAPGSHNSAPSQYSSTPADLSHQHRGRLTDITSLDKIWWDSGIVHTYDVSSVTVRDAKMYLDQIWPLQWGFFKLNRNPDRSFMFNAILECEPLRNASKSAVVTVQVRRIQNQKCGGSSGIIVDARRLYISTIRGLKSYVEKLGQARLITEESTLNMAIRALSIVLTLASTEFYDGIDGEWNAHISAAGALLGLIQRSNLRDNSRSLKPDSKIYVENYFITGSLTHWMTTSQVQMLHLTTATFVWVDLVVASVHGPRRIATNEFNYSSLLQYGSIDTRSIMGCHWPIMTAFHKVNSLEIWIQDKKHKNCLDSNELLEQATRLEADIKRCIKDMDLETQLPAKELHEDSNAMTVIHAYGALVYLYTIVSGASPQIPKVRENVTRCLELFEALPSRIFLRGCWPYCIAGCMAADDQQERFRALVRRAIADQSVLGFTWKSLMVMEECWRLRRCEEGDWWWRNTLEYKNWKIVPL